MHAAVVADDLTGATDTTHGFAARGYEAGVLISPRSYRDSDVSLEEQSVVGVNTGSRYADSRRAGDAVSEAVSVIPAEIVYKKIDSTLRGNIGAEVNAALTAAGADLAVVAPAFPAAGRTTADGVHYVDGTPVAETEYGNDKNGPPSSTLCDCFATVDRPIETVDLATVDTGRDAVKTVYQRAIERHDSAPIVICDAKADNHLSTVADAAIKFDPLYVGSGGLAAQIDIASDAHGGSIDLELPPGAPLGVVGSVNATTLNQLDHLPNGAVIELDAVGTLTGDSTDTAATRAIERLREGQPTVLTAATDRKTVERTEAVGRERDLSPDEIRERIATGLANVAARTVDETTPSGLFLTGGDIAVAVVEALEATTIELTGKSVDAGIPIGRLADGTAAGTPVVTKAGGFGTSTTIINCLDTLHGTDA